LNETLITRESNKDKIVVDIDVEESKNERSSFFSKCNLNGVNESNKFQSKNYSVRDAFINVMN